jgi:hypothetical protein
MPDFEERIIVRDAERDIATFRLTSDEVAGLRVSILSTPPTVPTEGTGRVAFVGYPGTRCDIVTVQRGPDGPEMTLAGSFSQGSVLPPPVSGRQVTFQFDASALTSPPPGFSHPDPNLDLGGMSGGPILMKCETQSGIEYWAPAAVITQGEMRENLNGGLLFASRLDSLRSDGRI